MTGAEKAAELSNQFVIAFEANQNQRNGVTSWRVDTMLWILAETPANDKDISFSK